MALALLSNATTCLTVPVLDYPFEVFKWSFGFAKCLDAIKKHFELNHEKARLVTAFPLTQAYPPGENWILLGKGKKPTFDFEGDFLVQICAENTSQTSNKAALVTPYSTLSGTSATTDSELRLTQGGYLVPATEPYEHPTAFRIAGHIQRIEGPKVGPDRLLPQ